MDVLGVGRAGVSPLPLLSKSEAVQPPLSKSVATQTVRGWPTAEAAATAGTAVSKWKKMKKTTASEQKHFIYSGSFSRSRRLAKKSEKQSSSIKAISSGVVSVAPLPLYGPPIEGLRPFTVFPLAEEFARLGLDSAGLVGECLGGREGQLDDSGLGREELCSEVDESVASLDEELRLPREVAGQAREHLLTVEVEAGQAEVSPPEPEAVEGQVAASEGPGPGEERELLLLNVEKEEEEKKEGRLSTDCLRGDEEGSGGTVGRRGPAPTPHQHARGWAKPGQVQPGGQQEGPEAGAGGGAGGGPPCSPPRDTCTPPPEAQQPEGAGGGGPGGPLPSPRDRVATPPGPEEGEEAASPPVVKVRIPTSDKIKLRLARFEEQLEGWRVAMRELLDAKPGLVWGLGGAAVAECGQKWLAEHAAFLEQSLTLYADSPLWSWSDLGEGLEKLSKVARDLLAEEEAFLGMMQAALNPATVRKEVGLEEDWEVGVTNSYLDLKEKLERRVRLLCPWTLGLGKGEGKL